MVVEELVALLGFDLKGEANLRRFRDGLNTATRSLTSFVAAATTFAAVAGAAIGAGAATIAKSVIETGMEFENLRVQLEALEGSEAAAERAIEWIKDFAANTPLDLQGVTKAYASLRNFGIDPTNGSLQALTDTMAMSGKGQEHLDGIVLALGQAWTKQKLQGEEALQLIERGVPVWDLLATAMGKSVTEVQELSSAGKLGRQEIQLLIDAMGERAAGASEKMARTLSGITSRLGDMFQQFQLMIADAGFFDWFKEQVEGVADVFDRFYKDGTLKRVATQISDTFVRVGETLKSAFAGFNADSLASLIDGIGSIIETFANFASGIRQAVDAVGGFVAGLLGLEERYQGTFLVLAGIGAIVAPWQTAFAAVILAVDDLVAYLQGRNSVIGEIVKGLTNVFSNLAAQLSPVFAAVKAEWDALAAYFAPAFEPAIQFADGFAERLAEVDFAGAFAGLLEVAQKVAEAFGSVFQGIRDIGQAINDLFAVGADSAGGKTLASTIQDMDDVLGRFVASGLIANFEALKGIVSAVATAVETLGKALSAIAAGDLLAAWRTVGEGLLTIFSDLASAGERMAQAFVPNFSYQEAWNRVKAWFDGFVTWCHQLRDRIIDALTFDIPWPEPPAWLQQVLDFTAGMPTPQERSQGPVHYPPPIKPSGEVPAQSGLPPMFQKYADHLSAVGAGGVDTTLNTIANDNSVTNVTNTVNAPVTVNATTNASPQQIGASVRNGVSSAGLDVTRRMGVVGSSGGAAP